MDSTLFTVGEASPEYCVQFCDVQHKRHVDILERVQCINEPRRSKDWSIAPMRKGWSLALFVLEKRRLGRIVSMFK